MRAAWSGGSLFTTHRNESQQGFSCGPVPVVPPRLDFAIGHLKDSDNWQIKWLDGIGLVPKVLDSLRYDGALVAYDRDDFEPNVPILLHWTQFSVRRLRAHRFRIGKGHIVVDAVFRKQFCEFLFCQRRAVLAQLTDRLDICRSLHPFILSL